MRPPSALGLETSASTPSAWPPHPRDFARLFDIAEWKELEVTGAPNIALTTYSFYDMPGIRRSAVFVEPCTHEVDDAPMVLAQCDTFVRRENDRDSLVPVVGIGDVTLDIGFHSKFGHIVHSCTFDDARCAVAFSAPGLRHTVIKPHAVCRPLDRDQARALRSHVRPSKVA